MLEEHLPLFAEALRAQGYHSRSVALSERVARHFLEYFSRRAFTPADLDAGHAGAYLWRRLRVFDAVRGHPMSARHLQLLRATLHRFLRYLAGACPELPFLRPGEPRDLPGPKAPWPRETP